MAATYCMSGQGIKALIMSVTGTVCSSSRTLQPIKNHGDIWRVCAQ